MIPQNPLDCRSSGANQRTQKTESGTIANPERRRITCAVIREFVIALLKDAETAHIIIISASDISSQKKLLVAAILQCSE